MAPARTMVKLELFGLLGNVDFARAKFCAQDIIRRNPDIFISPHICGMVEFDWNLFLERKRRELRGEMWQFHETTMAFVDGELIGGPEEFVKWATENVNFEGYRTGGAFEPDALYETLAEKEYVDCLNQKQHEYAFMDVSVDGETAGRLVIELFSTIVPKTCKNFLALCTGEMGSSEHNELEVYPLCYQDHQIHRIVPNGWIQGGDIWHDKGDGGESIYGAVFEDENFAVKHNKRGIVGMANKGRHSNGSQFYITLQPSPWMDTKYVAFGQVIEGTETLKLLESQPTLMERPKKLIKIETCGRMTYQY